MIRQGTTQQCTTTSPQPRPGHTSVAAGSNSVRFGKMCNRAGLPCQRFCDCQVAHQVRSLLNTSRTRFKLVGQAVCPPFPKISSSLQRTRNLQAIVHLGVATSLLVCARSRARCWITTVCGEMVNHGWGSFLGAMAGRLDS